ncbi:hypothetical protein niasHS_000502 [Heterodera schachtii]|uniref:Uncharacterized protein n=1 Tax=Heterodera schachtii TaxID=97005 RepID=A0ABD2K4H0_HETSC
MLILGIILFLYLIPDEPPFERLLEEWKERRDRHMQNTIHPPQPAPPAPGDEEGDEEFWAQPWPEGNERVVAPAVNRGDFLLLGGTHDLNPAQPAPPAPQDEEAGQGEEMDGDDWANPWPADWNPADFVLARQQRQQQWRNFRWRTSQHCPQKVVFNAPFDNKTTYYVRVTNPGTNMDTIGPHPTVPKLSCCPPSCIKVLYLYM